MNEVLEKLPLHLMKLAVDQPYESYTALDHAVWRYVMGQNLRFLAGAAHPVYLEGLRKTGISLERIPNMNEMNRILRDIGWAAVTVDGFIPPSAFMEFQAHRVLVIAADIRPIDQIGYTPAPDIIHEAAGHAPIIADPEYSRYLVDFGIAGSHAFSNPSDDLLYNAIRHLSILKADPYSSAESIREAEEGLNALSRRNHEPSELSLIRNLHWWTVEYGLIGDPENPRIYGAGLLSSIAESQYCLQPEVKKIPYSIEAVKYGFDITNPQPQLFITPDFATLSAVLEQFTQGMAWKTGGIEGLRKAIRSEKTASCEFSSGIQLTGTFTSVIDFNGEVAYLRTNGPSSLNYRNVQLPGHDRSYHASGFGSPAGRLKQISIPPEEFSIEELGQVGLAEGERASLEFESGVKVSGILRNITIIGGRPVLLSFSDCLVTYRGETLFEPSWGMYDMVLGRKVVSVFAGAADPRSFGMDYQAPSEKTHRICYSAEARNLHEIYGRVREIREHGRDLSRIKNLWEHLEEQHPGDWLCALEIYELLSSDGTEDPVKQGIRKHLKTLAEQSDTLRNLILDGLSAIEQARRPV